MYVSGGGSGSGSVSVGGNNYASITLFTTPNVANTMYVVTWNWANGRVQAGSTSYNVWRVACFPSIGDGVGFGPRAQHAIKVGPNIAVRVEFASGYTYGFTGSYSYNYVSIVMDTN